MLIGLPIAMTCLLLFVAFTGVQSYQYYDAVTCNFDEEDICGYEQLKIDRLDWGRQKDDSEGFGPETDHTGQGYYMYLRDPENPSADEKAMLASLAFRWFYTYGCLSFWAYTFGYTKGYIQIYVVSSGYEKDLLHKLKPQGSFLSVPMSNWTELKVNLSTSIVYANRIVISALVTGDVLALGDISIDDVSLKPGDCTGGGLLSRGMSFLGVSGVVFGLFMTLVGILVIMMPRLRRSIAAPNTASPGGDNAEPAEVTDLSKVESGSQPPPGQTAPGGEMIPDVGAVRPSTDLDKIVNFTDAKPEIETNPLTVEKLPTEVKSDNKQKPETGPTVTTP